MYVLIRYPAGVIVEGVILAKDRNCMRVAAAGFPDTIELMCSGSQWFTASEQPVEFDFFLSNDNAQSSLPSSESAPLASAAGMSTIQFD